MNFKITKLEIENFRSIQNKVTLTLKSGLFSIEGINYTETNSTNGSGKSTLISALFWALTGSSLTNEVLADEVVNLKVNKNCRVSVYITTDKDEIKVTRVRKDTEHGNNLFLEINGQDLSCHKVADTQDRINKLIKIPFSLLRNTIIMTSGMDSAFSSLTPQQRIQTLESIRDYSIWERIRDEANKDSKEYSNQITSNESEINVLKGRISTYKEFLEKANQSLQNSTDTTQWDSEINKNKEELEKAKKLIEEQEAKIAAFDNSVIDSSDLLKQMSIITDEVNTLKAKVKDKKDSLQKEINELEYNKRDLEKEKSTLERWFKDDTCPTCGKKLDRTQEEISNKSNKIKQIENDITICITNINNKENSTELSDLEKEVEIEINKKREEYKDLQYKLNNIKELQEEKQRNFNALRDKLLQYKSNEANAKAVISMYENKKKEAENRINEYKESITKYNEEVKAAEDKQKQLEEENVKLNNKKTLSDFYYKLLGAKGELRPYLLNKDIAYLNNRMQFYIGRFFKNTEVSLLLNGASIDIKIQADGVIKTISSLSGGEKKRVDISIQLALYDLIQMVSQSKFNLLCLDEIESLLDPIGCEQLIEIIEDKAENIETVWWITNHPSVKESIPQKILVKKILGKTEVEEL